MPQAAERSLLEISSGEVLLAGEDSRGGRSLVLAHGLTATRRYVLHGSRLLERAGYRVVNYDARGHGESTPAGDPQAYGYEWLVGDLGAVLDVLEIERGVLVGHSMGAATIIAFALEHPERVEALVPITPAYRGHPPMDPESLERWDELADALEREGVEGFMRAYGEPPIEPRFRKLVLEAIRQRMERHRYPKAVAAALRIVPRSSPFDGLDELEQLRMPTLVVASRDEADPEHPYEVAREYADRIPGAELISEEPGESPLAWRGARLSRAIGDFLAGKGLDPVSDGGS
jgi:pimeloyl-ACP methyl ester carboxylesterase